MTARTTSKTVTFTHPFQLSGTDEVQPAGTYTVETDEELLETSLLLPPAYRRISTLLRLPANAIKGTGLTQMVEIDPLELAAIMAGDAAIPQPMRGESVVRQRNAASRNEATQRDWSRWLAWNGNGLAWIALIVGNILFTTWLLRG